MKDIIHTVKGKVVSTYVYKTEGVDPIIERHRGQIRPCKQEMDAVEREIRARYPMVELARDDRKLQFFAYSILSDSVDESVLDELEFPLDYAEERGYRPCGLLVLNEGAGERLYAYEREEFESKPSRYKWHEQEIVWLFDHVSGRGQISSSHRLADELILLRGVDQTEIDTESVQLLLYLEALEALETEKHEKEL